MRRLEIYDVVRTVDLSDAPACSSATDWYCSREWRRLCGYAHTYADEE